jgi:hypothetical protein
MIWTWENVENAIVFDCRDIHRMLRGDFISKDWLFFHESYVNPNEIALLGKLMFPWSFPWKRIGLSSHIDNSVLRITHAILGTWSCVTSHGLSLQFAIQNPVMLLSQFKIPSCCSIANISVTVSAYPCLSSTRSTPNSKSVTRVSRPPLLKISIPISRTKMYLSDDKGSRWWVFPQKVVEWFLKRGQQKIYHRISLICHHDPKEWMREWLQNSRNQKTADWSWNSESPSEHRIEAALLN